MHKSCGIKMYIFKPPVLYIFNYPLIAMQIPCNLKPKNHPLVDFPRLAKPFVTLYDNYIDRFRQVFGFYKIDHRLGFSEGRSIFMAGIFFVKGSFWRGITVIVGRIVL